MGFNDILFRLPMYSIVKMLLIISCQVPVHSDFDECSSEQSTDSDIGIIDVEEEVDSAGSNGIWLTDSLCSITFDEEEDSYFLNLDADSIDIAQEKSGDGEEEENDKIYMEGIINESFGISSEPDSIRKNAIKKAVEFINRKIAIIKTDASKDESNRNEKINGLEHIILEVQQRTIHNVVLYSVDKYHFTAIKIIEHISLLDDIQIDLDPFLDSVINDL